jgi:hypothetical protein
VNTSINPFNYNVMQHFRKRSCTSKTASVNCMINHWNRMLKCNIIYILILDHHP